MDDALDKASMENSDTLEGADIIVDARVTLESETPQTMFGQTFLVRTFTTEMAGRARPNRRVPMPPPKSVSFDPRNRALRADDLEDCGPAGMNRFLKGSRVVADVGKSDLFLFERRPAHQAASRNSSIHLPIRSASSAPRSPPVGR